MDVALWHATTPLNSITYFNLRQNILISGSSLYQGNKCIQKIYDPSKIYFFWKRFYWYYLSLCSYRKLFHIYASLNNISTEPLKMFFFLDFIIKIWICVFGILGFEWDFLMFEEVNPLIFITHHSMSFIVNYIDLDKGATNSAKSFA